MAIGDLLASIMGKPDPRAQIAQALGSYPGQPGSNAGPMPGSGAGAAAPGLAQQGQNTPGANQAPPPGFQASQQPQPQAYQSPPDLANAYLNLMNRQQANQGLNMGLGLMAAGLSHNQGDRQLMIGAMENLNQEQAGGMGGAGGMGQLVNLIQAQHQMQMQSYLMAHAAEGAKSLGISPEQYLTAYMTGTLGDIQKSAIERQALQASPLYQAQVSGEQARTAQSQATTETERASLGPKLAQTAAETEAAKGRTAEAAAATQATQLTTQQKQDLMAHSDDLAKQYNTDPNTMRSIIDSGGFPTFSSEIQKFKLQQDSPLYKAQTQEAQLSAAKAATEAAQRTALLSQASTLAKQYNMDQPSVESAINNGNWDKIVAADTEAKMRSSLVAQETAERVTAENKAKALPMALEAQDKLRATMDLGDEILDPKNAAALAHLVGPGRYTAGGVIREWIPGSPEANLQAKIDQLEGTTGVEAVKSLIGGGRVLGTEFTEGMKAQSTLHDEHQSVAQFRQAIQNYQNKSMGEAWSLFKQADAQGKFSKDMAKYLPKWAKDEYASGPGAGPRKRVYNPSTGEFE